MQLPEIKADKTMPYFCFKTLQAKLKKEQIPKCPSQYENIKCPIFVTWLLEGELRGCIGTFSHQLLSKLLGKYALISALNDDRFQPIQLKQLPKLSVNVSLLVNFRKDQGILDWDIGKNGIILHLKRNGKYYEATYLPEVAQQQNWTHQQTLISLLQKAGYSGPYNLVKNDIKLTTYESSKASMNYNEYLQMKQQQQKQKQKEAK